MKFLLVASVAILASSTEVVANDTPRISLVESSTPTEALMAKTGHLYW